MGLYTNNDLPTWPSRVFVVWAKVMETTRIDSAHAETASEHAANGENAYDVINLSFFSHLCGRSCHCRCSLSSMLLLQTRHRFLFKTALAIRVAWVKSSMSVQSMHKFSKMRTWAIISTLLSSEQARNKYWVWWIQVLVCAPWFHCDLSF
jgi:hypothetical protein